MSLLRHGAWVAVVAAVVALVVDTLPLEHLVAAEHGMLAGVKALYRHESPQLLYAQVQAVYPTRRRFGDGVRQRGCRVPPPVDDAWARPNGRCKGDFVTQPAVRKRVKRGARWRIWAPGGLKHLQELARRVQTFAQILAGPPRA